LTAPLICLLRNDRRKNRGRRSRRRRRGPDHHSCFRDESSTCEPLLANPHNSFTSEEFCQTSQALDPAATEFPATPVKGHQTVIVNPSRVGVSPLEADCVPFHPLGTATNISRPPFLSPLGSPRKPRNARFARPVRAMMDIFLDSRARSDMEDESDDESFRDIERRLGIRKNLSTPESPTPPSSRASSRDTESSLSTPTRASKYPLLDKSPRMPGSYLWRTNGYQEYPSELAASPRPKKSSTLADQRDGFWKREAERLRSCAPKILLPSWHLGLTGRGDGEDTERLMTLAEVSLASMELGTSDLDLGPPEHRRFEVSGDRSTADWS